MSRILGWDIGGVNTKAALVTNGVLHGVVSRPFELQRSPEALTTRLQDMAHALNGGEAPDAHAVTMTAELSQMFRTKREGVGFVLDAVERAFPGAAVHVYTTAGSFVAPAAARREALLVAAANWAATANLVARHHPDALLVDIGTTTTDLIPLCDGRVAARGRTDPQRLASGELVYTGVVRTPVEAIVRHVPLHGRTARASAEAFALSGDVHVWLGALAPADYDAATPDGRPSSRAFAGERLARVVCADRDLLDDAGITAIAEAAAQAQIEDIREAIRQVRREHPSIATAVVTGLGAFVGTRAAIAAGLDVVPLSKRLGADGARCAAATAVALLLYERLNRVAGLTRPAPSLERQDELQLETWREAARSTNTLHRVIVIKIGGSLLTDPEQWRAALSTLAAATESQRLVIVPGGGPFTDAVRRVDERFRLADEPAHWMAIAGMDQHAEMIAAAGAPFAKVTDSVDISALLDRHQVPVVAPLRWLRAADPLPHSWDITSDSIAAWIAGRVNAARLIVIKSAGASGPASLDPCFVQTLPRDLPWAVCDARGLEAQLAGLEPSPR